MAIAITPRTSLFAERGVDVVLPQHQRRKTDFRHGEPLGRDDHIAVWDKPKRPDWLDESLYTLVTTLLDPQSFRAEALRAIKQVLGMEVLRGQTPAMVEKEIAVHVLAYNLIRALLAKSADQHGLPPRTLSFSAALQLLLTQGVPGWSQPSPRALIEAILATGASRGRSNDDPSPIHCSPNRAPKPAVRSSPNTPAEPVAVAGRSFSPQELRLIARIVERYPKLSRQELSATVCELLRWERPSGQLKTRECRDLLQRLHPRGQLCLPEKAAGRPTGAATRTPEPPAPPRTRPLDRPE